MVRYSRLTYPPPLFGSLQAATLTADMEKLEDYRTFSHIARRVPLSFDKPAILTVRVSSSVGSRNGWLRSGCLAQCLDSLPSDPKKAVQRLYLDTAVFEFEGFDYPYYFEFWPYRWLTDYRLELWAKLAPRRIVQLIGSFFTIDGEPFTVDGVGLIL